MTNAPTSRYDHVLAALCIILVGVSLVMVYSASNIVASEKLGDATYYLRRQAMYAAVGVIGMGVAAAVPYQLYRKVVYPGLGLAVLLLAAVLVVGDTRSGATRWIELGGFSFQPSEPAKLAVIFYLAYSLDKKQANIKSFEIGILPHLITCGVVLALIMLEPDFGTCMVLAAILGLMMFLAGVKLSHLAALVAAALPFFGLVMVAATYRVKRLMTFLDPWADPMGDGFQIIQSWVAFAGGGLPGAGLGNGLQKIYYLPEAHTDFIFAVIGEELGFIGVMAILALFAALVYRGLRVAERAPDLFGCLLGLGLTSLIGLQALINMMVVTGLLPTKGLTLPFLSFGGTSLIISMSMVGVLLNISASQGRVARARAFTEEEKAPRSGGNRAPMLDKVAARQTRFEGPGWERGAPRRDRKGG